MTQSKPLWVHCALCLALLATLACRKDASKIVPEDIELPPDAKITKTQAELLEIAMSAVTAMPADPHLTDRSKAQGLVVTACLQLDVPNRARGYVKEIGDWRQGQGYADLAFYCAGKAMEDSAHAFLALAEMAAEKAEDWRRDSIRSRIAQTHALMGDMAKAREFEANLTESESGRVAGITPKKVNAAEFDRQFASIQELVAKENFDLTRNALSAAVRLFGGHYSEGEKREVAEELIRSSWGPMPIIVRLEWLMEMADFAAGNNDRTKAQALVNEARSVFDEHEWPLEYAISLASKLASARHRAGETEKARFEMQSMRDLFDTRGKEIVNIWRAGAIRPLAEAYVQIGDRESALEVYKLAVEAGFENPNSRPRADDLSATCISMAVNGVEPDEALFAKIREIRQALGDPW